MRAPMPALPTSNDLRTSTHAPHFHLAHPPHRYYKGDFTTTVVDTDNGPTPTTFKNEGGEEPPRQPNFLIS